MTSEMRHCVVWWQ